jgi:hypothetical protein
LKPVSASDFVAKPIRSTTLKASENGSRKIAMIRLAQVTIAVSKCNIAPPVVRQWNKFRQSLNVRLNPKMGIQVV